MNGTTLRISEEIHAAKYRESGEDFRDAMGRIAGALKDTDDHYHSFRRILLEQKFLPAGRVQAAAGAVRSVTPYNCFVSETIDDSMDGIMECAKGAATTMRLGGGIGFDYSPIRPANSRIKSLDTRATGPVSFMSINDSVCKTIASAGHRRGAMMAMLNVAHPDIEEFISAKRDETSLTQFNISVAVTDEFMKAVKEGTSFDLRWPVTGPDYTVYKTVDARALWDRIMRNTWDWAEPGVIFIDRINEMNNLWYCEDIRATNPCAEQPLPPNGACLLGSINLVKYIEQTEDRRYLNMSGMLDDLAHIVRAMDNVVDRAIYPLEAQKEEAFSKRRMGLGFTGVANAVEALGYRYGSKECIDFLEIVFRAFTNECYRISALLAKEKGAFPLYDPELYLKSEFLKVLDEGVIELIKANGIRNSHLTSIAPTGTISLTADNVSSGIEPVFSLGYDRTIQTADGPIVEHIDDYGYRTFGTIPHTAGDCTPDEHLNILLVASKWMDSAVSKTCNIGDDVTWDEFKDVYMKAYDGGAKGCTTFRAAGKRYGILNAKPKSEEEQGAACYIDPETGTKTCE